METRTIPTATVPDRLVAARRKAHITQVALADRLDVDRSTVVRWETGRTPTPTIAMYAYAALTGVDLDWLEHGERRRHDEPIDIADRRAERTARDETPAPTGGGRRPRQRKPSGFVAATRR